MDADRRKIPAEAWLEEGARRGVERLTRAAQRRMHAVRRLFGLVSGCVGALGGEHAGRLLLAGGAFAADLLRRTAETHIRLRHPHDLVGGTIGLVLQRVVGAAEG